MKCCRKLRSILIINILVFITVNITLTNNSLKKNNKKDLIEPHGIVLSSKEKTYFDDMESFRKEVIRPHKSYNDYLLLASSADNPDIIINNSGTKDHLFRFSQSLKSNKNSGIDIKKVTFNFVSK